MMRSMGRMGVMGVMGVMKVLAGVVLLAPPAWAGDDPVRVVSATTTLGYFAEQIGGALVEVESIAAGNRDLHYVEALPSHMLKLRKAQLYLTVGMELDIWSKQLIQGSRNGKLRVVDCSAGVAAMEVPTFKADARYGDLHPYGNPHYWLDPANVPAICRNIAGALSAADPDHAADYNRGLESYLAKLETKVAEWETLKPKLADVRFVAYHNTWPYLCRFFGCRMAGFVEEFPGVAPSPSHLARLIEQIKGESIPLVVYEPFHDKRVPNMLAERTGCRVEMIPESIGGAPGTDTYEGLIDFVIARLTGTGGGTTP